MMIDSGEGDFAMPPEPIDIVSGQIAYDLITLMSYNPVKIRLVERNYVNLWVTLKKWEKNIGTLYQPGIGISDFFPTYRFTGTSLVFNIIPSFNEVGGIRVEGYKLPAEMSADADSPVANFHPIYHNLLVLWATVGGMESKEFTGTKDESTLFRMRLEKMEQRFINIMNNRTESPETVDPFSLSGDY